MRKVLYFAILLDACTTIIGIHYYGLKEANPLFNWIILKLGVVNAMLIGLAMSAAVMEFMLYKSEKDPKIAYFVFLFILFAKLAAGINNSILLITTII